MDADELTQAIIDSAYGTVYDHLNNSGETCPWCFDRVRRLHPEHTEAKAREMHDGGTDTVAIEATGVTVRGDGSLLVNRPASDADPGAYQEVAPPTRLPAAPWYPSETRYVPPRSQTICPTCGVVDHDFTNDRSRTIRLYTIGNIADHLHRLYLRFDELAAQEVVHEASKRPTLAGQDHRVLKQATVFGLEQAYGGGRSRTASRPDDDIDGPTRTPPSSVVSIASFGD